MIDVPWPVQRLKRPHRACTQECSGLDSFCGICRREIRNAESLDLKTVEIDLNSIEIGAMDPFNRHRPLPQLSLLQ